MGTGNSGLYKSLAQAVKRLRSVSCPVGTIIHASIGEYTKNSGRLKSGCHSQAGIKELERRGIGYEIEKTYSNGVRVGCISNHTNANRRKGGGHTWFPKDWTSGDIIAATKAIIGSHEGPVGNGTVIIGVYNNVRIAVVVRNNQIKTVYPTVEQEL